MTDYLAYNIGTRVITPDGEIGRIEIPIVNANYRIVRVPPTTWETRLQPDRFKLVHILNLRPCQQIYYPATATAPAEIEEHIDDDDIPY